MNDPIRVEFESRYEGRIADVFFEKLRMFLTMLTGALLILILAVYLAFIDSSSPEFVGYLLYFLSLFVLLGSLIVPLFIRYNKGLRGSIVITIVPTERVYQIEGEKRNGTFYEKEKVGILDIRKKTILVGKDIFHAYRIPKKVLTESQIEGLTALKAAMKK